MTDLQIKMIPMNLIGVNPPSGCWVPASARFQEWLSCPVLIIMPMQHWWSNDHDVVHLQAETAPVNLIWSEPAQWLLRSSAHMVTRVIITPLDTPMGPDEQMTMMLHIYKWVRSRNCGCLVTWFCYQLIAKPGNKTATVSWPDPDQDGSNELNLEWIRQAVAEFQPPFQEWSLHPWARPCGPNGQITMTLHIYRSIKFLRTFLGRADGQRLFHSPPYFHSERQGTIKCGMKLLIHSKT